MSIKDVLLGLAVQDEIDPAREFALALAAQYRAHVTAVAYGLTPDLPFSIYPEFVSGVAQQFRAIADQAIEAAHARFEQAARTADVEHTFEKEVCSPQTAAWDFMYRLRTTDIGVITQHKSGELERFGDLFLESALFHSGRPLIVVPRAFRQPFSLDRVLIAWDASIHATRAVAAAAPLLAPGATIEVFTVEETSKGTELRGSALVQNLRRHGLDAGLAERRERDIPKAILCEIETFRANLVVMGGYGHSRVRQFVFGGVTRLMLNKMPVPVLMSH
jgi:nucleotide-binding universal stress UspA family protein